MDNDKMYTYSSLIDGEFIGRFISLFPNIYYKKVITPLTIINLLLFFNNSNLEERFIFSTICFIIVEIVILIFTKLKFDVILKIIFKGKKLKEKAQYSIEFYKNYLISKMNNNVLTFKYEDIDKCYEINDNFVLVNSDKKIIGFIQKNHCDLGLINFIKEKFNIEKCKKMFKIEQDKTDIEKFNKLAVLTIYMYFLALYMKNLFFIYFDEKINFIALIYFPIPLITIIIGSKYRKKYPSYEKYINITLVLSFLLFFASLNFIYN